MKQNIINIVNIVLIPLFIWISLVLGVLPPAHGATPEAPVTVRDFRGKAVILAQPARRIVCLIESALSALYMLHAENQVVGVSTSVYQTDVFPYYARMDERVAGKTLPTPGNWDFVNIESVLGLAPDLVIIWAHQQEAISALEERGVPVYGVSISAFQDIYREVEALGRLTGRTARAGELVRHTQARVAALTARIAALPPPEASSPRVYFMWAQGPLETAGKNSSAHELISLAGGVNVSGHIPREHTVVNIENILTWNPEVVCMWYNPRKDPSDLIQTPPWPSVNAVKTGRVHELPETFTCDFWTLKYSFAVMALAKWCYPASLGHLDLEAEKARMLAFLYGNKLQGS